MSNATVPDLEPTRRGFVTGYPAFRHWRREAVEEGLSPQPLNIYLHFPYCIQRCGYCHYKTTTLRKTQLAEIDRYVESLCREIRIASDRFHLKERPAISLYFGGGTPSLLSPGNIERIMATLHQHLTLREPEITFEAEPVTLTRRKAEVIAAHGVNRISVGIQSFSDEIVSKTGRRDSERHAREAIECALSTGAVVNLDLISGLAGETAETWAYSLRRAVETAVHSITVYKLEIYANTEYFAQLRSEGLSLPSDDQELAFARSAIDTLGQAGYIPVNFFTFTRGGDYIQRHTTTKWQGVDVYAFGSSAFGALGNWAFQNTNDLGRYSDLLDDGQLPIFRGYSYNALEMMTRDVLLGMKLLRLDRSILRKRYGIDPLWLCGDTLERLQADGFITMNRDAIALTDKGILYGDYAGRCLAASLEALAPGVEPSEPTAPPAHEGAKRWRLEAVPA